MSKRTRTDDNQAEIVTNLRYFGATVQDLHEVGHGCPDILVGYHGLNFLFEIKIPGKDLRPTQSEWQSKWKGRMYRITSFEEAVQIIIDAIEDLE